MTDYVYDQQGRRRRVAPDYVLQDGERLVVRLDVMDSAPLALHDGMGNAAGHKPGFVFADGAAKHMADAALDSAHEQYEAKLTEAWRKPASERQAPVADGRQDAYAAYEARLTSAWRAV